MLIKVQNERFWKMDIAREWEVVRTANGQTQAIEALGGAES